MAAKKETEDKTIIKQFKDSSSQWWVNIAHYKLEQNGEITWCAGEQENKEARDSLENYIKRNKKQFKERSPSIFDSEPKQYNEKIGFGQYSDLTVSQLFDENPKYIKWMLEKYTFNSAQTKLKEQITEILKK